ncbi:MAG: butyrate kinase [Candidatus Zixiibacteriota bacterium]|nr:MAG: butyrate kinase [candidate division Zixibacteria bacterium]
MAELMFIINPGSTSTKAALFDGNRQLAEETVRHDANELGKFDNVADQFDYRMQAINAWIDSLDYDANQVKAIVGRGAPLRPLEGGSYEITEQLLEDVRTAKYSNHASNLGSIIAHHLGERFGVPSMISDPITVDNFTDIARVSGVPEIQRKCRVHALNIKEVCRREAAKLGKKLDEVSFVAVHMGGGVSVAALKRGLVVDVNDALLGMGPFSPDRSGALPIGGVVKLCFSGEYTEKELTAKFSKKSGLVAYLGQADLREVEKMIDSGDKKALLYFNAMAYQIAKEIGVAATVLAGEFESIVLTGGMAHSKKLVAEISKYVSFLGKVTVVPGEFEMEALAAAGIRFLSGQEQLKKY